MSVLRKLRKNVEKNILRFPAEMYNNVLGSLVITHYLLYTLEGKEVNLDKIKSTWRKLAKKRNLDFWIDDKEFITKALNLFDLQPCYGKFAACQSAFNLLFLPYIDGNVLPIREDGIYPMTARDGKVYPVLETNKETEESINENE